MYETILSLYMMVIFLRIQILEEVILGYSRLVRVYMTRH